jgi:hypothetical protein
MLVGKGKRGADLFEARGVLRLAQEPIGLQGGSFPTSTEAFYTVGPLLQ